MQLLSNQATLLIDPEVNANTWDATRVLYEYEWGECYCTRFVPNKISSIATKSNKFLNATECIYR